jgi:RNA recognition motif-containing protein
MNDQAKLFVGNLPFEANEDQVRELFSNYGTVADVKIIMDKMTGRSRGFAFVRMSTQEEATQAKEGLHGQMFLGKSLVIDWAKSEEQRGPRPERRSFGDRPPRRDGGFERRGGGGGFHRG